MSRLPAGWTEAVLGELCLPVQKHDPRDQPTVQIQYIDIGGIVDQRIAETKSLLGTDAPSRARQLVKAGDTVLSTVRTYLRKTALVPPELDGATASTGFCVLRPGRALHPRFLLHRVLETGFVSELSAMQTGSSYPAVRDRKVLDRPIALPPLSEQRRIVAAIDEQLSRIDSADISVSDTSRRLGAFGASVIAQATSGDWPVVALGQISSSMRYGTSVKCLPGADGPAVLRIPNIRDGRIDTSDLKFATVTRTELGDCFVVQGDLLFVRTNGSRDLIGRVASVAADDDLAFASYLIRARPDQERVDPQWLVLALSSPRARAEMQARAATTAGQYNLNLPSLRSLLIPLPPIDEQRTVMAAVEQRLSVVNAMNGAIDSARRRSTGLRRSILERAFRGDLVPQDPSEEPATVLLERIRVQRAETDRNAVQSARKKRDAALPSWTGSRPGDPGQSC